MRALLMYTPMAPTSAHLERLEAVGLRVTVAAGEAQAVAAAPEAELIIGQRYLAAALPCAQKVRGIIATTGRWEALPAELLTRRDVRLVRASYTAVAAARHATRLAWSLQESVNRVWAGFSAGPLATVPGSSKPRRALVLGAGALGEAIAQCLQGDNIEVYAIRRRPDLELAPGIVAAGDWEQSESWWGHSDWCFNALPATAGWPVPLGEEWLARLPRHALFVNVANEATVALDQLCQLIGDDRLGGAGLDLWERESVKEGHRVLQTPRLLVTRRAATNYPERLVDTERFVEEQVSRLLQGELEAEAAPEERKRLPA
jgi:phosphoglycerate dehydrogenase-like enzyme